MLSYAMFSALLTIQNNLFLFYLSFGGNIKRLEDFKFFVLLSPLMCSNLIFNLLKRVTDDSFLFLCSVSFSFSTFLEFGHPN